MDKNSDTNSTFRFSINKRNSYILIDLFQKFFILIITVLIIGNITFYSITFEGDISLFPGCLDQFLAKSVPHRNDKSAAIRKLIKKRLGDFGRTGRNNDGIIGLIFLPSEGSVKGLEKDIVIT